MSIKDFFSGIIKPNPAQNAETKKRLKEIFLKSTGKTELGDIIILYGNSKENQKFHSLKLTGQTATS